jgi:hypothetical protein
LPPPPHFFKNNPRELYVSIIQRFISSLWNLFLIVRLTK